MKWQVKQKIKRIAALLLSFVLLFDALEISAPAPVVRAMEESFGAFCAVTSFAELPQELREQTLPLGAQESDIELPDSLDVTADVLKELPENTAPAQTANAAQGGTTIAWNDEIPEEEEVLDADAEPQATQTPVQPQTIAAAQDNVSLTVDGVEELPYVQNTVTLSGVKWRIDKERSAEDTFLADEEHAGATYTYVAVLPEKDNAGNTIVLQKGAQLPEIHVSVEGEKDVEPEKETERVTEAESKTEKETETEKITEKVTETEIETKEETDAEAETGSDLAVEKETEKETGSEKLGGKETEIEEITETELETETETKIEIEEETDAETETGSDLAVEKETGKETETEELTEKETEEISETECETEELTETETEEISETESEIETEIEAEIEEQEVSLMSLAGDGENGTEIDLTPYITDVEFTWEDENGVRWPIEKNEQGEYEFPAKHTLGFKLRYRIPKGTIKAGDILTYPLPDDFKYKESEGTIVWGKTSAGTYTIKDNVVTLKFDNEHGFFDTDIDFTGYVSFESRVDEDQVGKKDDLYFKEDVEFSYTITKKEEEGSTSTDSSFNAQKTATWIDDGTLEYTITATAGKNGATNVELKDWMSAQVNSGASFTDFDFDIVSVKNSKNDDLRPLETIWIREECDKLELDEPGNGFYTADSDTYEATGGWPESEGQEITKYKDKDGNLCYTVIKTGSKWFYNYVIVPEPGYYIVQHKEEGGSYKNIFWLPDMDPYETYTVTYRVNVWKQLADEGITYNPTWDSYKISNSVYDGHDQQRDGDEQSRTNTWIKKYTTNQGELKLNKDGEYEIGWKVEINPDHQALNLQTGFSDSLAWPDGVTGVKFENGNLHITVTGKDETNQNVIIKDVDVSSNLLEELTSGMSITEILRAAGVTVEGDTTTDYSIALTYTTTVTADSLPEGTTKATNTGTLTEAGKPGPSASASVDMQNSSLKKEVGGDVTMSTAKYSKDGVEARVLLIPWKATVKMAAGDYTDVNAYIQDVFTKESNGGHLWVTPQYLRENLKLYFTNPNGSANLGKPVNSDWYTLSYTTDGTTYTDSADDAAVLKGFRVNFKSDKYGEIAGQKLELDYVLFGDADFLKNESEETDCPSRTFTNQIYYGDSTVEESYTGWGDSLLKESEIGFASSENREVSWEKLTDNQIAWNVVAGLSELSQGEDITITDKLPAPLKLYSFTVQRGHYNVKGTTDTVIVSEEGSSETHDELTLYEFWDTGKAPIVDGDPKIVVITQKQEDGSTTITAKIPKELIEKNDEKNWFKLKIVAAIPDDADILNLNSDCKTQAFENHGYLTIDGDTRGADSNTVTVTNDKALLKKDGVYTESDSAHIMYYTLKVNPGGLERLRGEPLTLKDSLKYTPDIVSGDQIQKEQYLIKLIPESVKVYFYDERGQKVYLPARDYDFSYTYEETDVTAADGTPTGERENKLTILVPDKLEAYVEYDYELWSAQDNAKWDISNSATLEGIAKAEDTDSKHIEYTKSAAEVEKNFVDFYKVDKDNYNVTLPGAEFALYVWEGDADKGSWKEWSPTSRSVQKYVSDSKGQLPIKELESETLYRLVETKAPAGYEISPEYGQPESEGLTGDAGYYFYLVDSTKMPVVIPSSLTDNGIEIHELSGANTVYIPNEPSDTGSITAQKVWADGTDRVDIELTLYKGYKRGYTYEDTLSKNGAEPKLVPVTKDSNDNDLVSTKEIKAGAPDDAWTVTWENLPSRDEKGTIYYYVFETKADGTGEPVALENGGYSVNGYEVEYDNNSGLKAGTVVITNSRTSISVKKEWSDGEGNHSEDDIKVGLYQSFTPPMSKEEAGKPKKVVVNLGAENAADFNYWNNRQVVYATDGKSKIYAGNYKENSKDITSDAVKIVINLNVTNVALTEDDFELLCSDGNVAFNLQSTVAIIPSYQYQFVWEVSNITKASEFYVYVDTSIDGWNSSATITELESRGTGSQHPEDLEPAKLPDGQSAQVTLNEDNKWQCDWKDLPKVAADPDDGGKLKPVYYYVEEEYYEGYTSTYSYEYNSDGTTFKGVTITNTPEIVTETSIKAIKKWLTSSGDDMTPGKDWKVELQLYQLQEDGTPVPYPDVNTRVTLSQTNGWEYEWTELPPGEYCVEEVNRKEGFTVSYESKLSEGVQDDFTKAMARKGEITVYNTAPTTEIEVVKKWMTSKGEKVTPEDDWYVEMQLYQSTTPPVNEPTKTSITVQVEYWLTSIGEILESVPSDGEITVKIYECDKSGNRMSDDPLRIVTLNSGNKWEITVDDLNGVTTDSTGTETEHYYQAEYFADETNILGVKDTKNDTNISEKLSGGLDTNTVGLIATAADLTPKQKHITLNVNKNDWGSWRVSGTTEKDIEVIDQATVKIAYSTGIPEDPESVVSLDCTDPSVTCKYIGKEDEVSFNGMPCSCLCYRISNLRNAADEITLNFWAGTTSSWDNTNIIEPYPNTSVATTFASRSVPRKMSAPSGIGTPKVAEDSLKLPDATPVQDDSGKNVTVKLNNVNMWEKEWPDLPQYNSKGQKLYYYVKEIGCSQDIQSIKYEYIYPDEPWRGIKAVTVTNILPDISKPKTTSVTVNKNWVNYEGGETNDYKVQVRLYRREVIAEQGAEEDWATYDPLGQSGLATLTQSDSWEHTWSGLIETEWTNADTSHTYEYRVREVKVLGPSDSEGSGEVEINNFTSETSGRLQEDGSYSFTITNTKKRQGITLPGTGSKYPWIFYGIGTTFLLIALAWMSRALKKSYIPSDTGKGGRQSDE